MKTNHWYAVKRQSLARFARLAGFDLAVYEDYDDRVRARLKARAIREALWEIRDICDDEGLDLHTGRRGVYVISLSNPLSVCYERRRSQVIYIGIGEIYKRIKSHFEATLFDLMLDLSGAEFDFYFAIPRLRHARFYYKHVEYLMLEYFNENYGGMGNDDRFPLLNTNAGSDKGYRGGRDWWKKPLKSSGHAPLWELKPTQYSDYAPLD